MIDIFLFVYFVSVIVCLVGYLWMTIQSIGTDTCKRDEVLAYNKRKKECELGILTEEQFKELYPDYDWAYIYHPTITYGDLVVRVVLTITPVVNTVSMVVEVIPNIIPSLVDMIREVFYTPIVPER